MNVLERLMVSSRQGVLGASGLSQLLAEPIPRAGAAAIREQPAARSVYTLSDEVAEFERQEILEALDHSEGNVAAAARRLRIPRGTLRHKLRKYQLSGIRAAETL